MKKTLLTMSMVLAAVAANAQDKPTATVYSPKDNLNPLMVVSDNGRYLAGGDNVGVTLIDLETGGETLIIDSVTGTSLDGTTQEFIYDCSRAAGVTNDGMIVGSYGFDNSAPAAILKNGSKKWELLPVPAGFNSNGNSTANDVTSDGKYIVGYGAGASGLLYSPLLWTLQDDGTYAVEELPCPETDIWGSTPQYVIAYGISNDGTRAYGKLVDFTGYTTVGVIFKKDGDGTWTHQTVGEDYVIIGGDNPGPQPQFEDYVTAEEGTDEYWKQVSEFDMLVFNWWPAAEEYARLSSSPAYQILVNQNCISGNGKWVVIATPDGEGRLYDTGDMTYTPISCGGMSATAVTDNGDVLFASSMTGYASAYICPAGQYGDGAASLTSWLEANYDVTYDDGYAGGLGICNATPDGKTIVGFSRISEVEYVSAYVRTSDTATGIGSVDAGRRPYVAAGILYIPGGKASVSVYSTSGTRLAAFTAGASTDLKTYATGTAIVKVQTGKTVRTFKVRL